MSNRATVSYLSMTAENLYDVCEEHRRIRELGQRGLLGFTDQSAFGDRHMISLKPNKEIESFMEAHSDIDFKNIAFAVVSPPDSEPDTMDGQDIQELVEDGIFIGMRMASKLSQVQKGQPDAHIIVVERDDDHFYFIGTPESVMKKLKKRVKESVSWSSR